MKTKQGKKLFDDEQEIEGEVEKSDSDMNMEKEKKNLAGPDVSESNPEATEKEKKSEPRDPKDKAQEKLGEEEELEELFSYSKSAAPEFSPSSEMGSDENLNESHVQGSRIVETKAEAI